MTVEHFHKIKSSIAAYEWADANGFKYSRQRIGFSIYRHPESRHTIEIGRDHCAEYRPNMTPALRLPKASRLVRKCTYKAEPS